MIDSGQVTGRKKVKLDDNSSATSSEKNETQVVTILGRDYPLRCSEESELLVRVADYLDKKMRQISGAFSISSHSDIAVLAALNITHELFEAQGNVDVFAGDLEQRTKSIILKLEESLPELETTSVE